MSPLEIVLPIVILALSFLMKLFVDRSPDLPSVIETTYELPIDIIFLALTFAAAFCITHSSDAGRGLFHFAVYVGVAILAIMMSRRSNHFFITDKKLLAASIFVINSTTSVVTLLFSMRLVASK